MGNVALVDALVELDSPVHKELLECKGLLVHVELTEFQAYLDHLERRTLKQI